MKPFLILQLRPEAEASDGEYAAFLEKGGLTDAQVHRVCLDREPLPEGLQLADYAGVIVGGGPGCVSDDPASKDPVEARIEAEILALMPRIIAGDIPFLGCCYGIGILGAALGGKVGKGRYGEPVGPVQCRMTDAGRNDPLLDGVAQAFNAFVGHKEAMEELPDGAVHLLTSAPCPIQMLRYKSNIYATQFHPEADGAVFANRIRLYKNKGYFAPHEADDLIHSCMAAHVDQPEVILRNFITRFKA